jgi:predicted nucleic acid-binding protein
MYQREFHEEAARVLDLAAQRAFKIFASAHEMTTLAYFLEKSKRPPREIRRILSALFEQIRILAVDQEILEKALHSKMDDFEDAVLEAVSMKNELEFIVTRNVKDFRHSRVKAINPSLFLELIHEKPGDGSSVRECEPAYNMCSLRRRTRN